MDGIPLDSIAVGPQNPVCGQSVPSESGNQGQARIGELRDVDMESSILHT